MDPKPVPAARATRRAGKHTRQVLFDAATELFLEHGEAVSIARICSAADAHPNQVTYYYGSKEKLFVEVACAAILRAGKQAELDAADATTIGDYTHKLVGSLLGTASPSVEIFVEAMVMTGRRGELRDLISTTLRTLHASGEAALLGTLARTGWQLRASIDVEAKAFWSAIFGLVVQKTATGESFGYSLEEAVAVIFATLRIPDAVLNQSMN